MGFSVIRRGGRQDRSPPGGVKGLLWRLVRFVALLYGALTVAACSMIDKAMFPVPTPRYLDQAPVFHVPKADGGHLCVVQQAATGQGVGDGWTILLSHGNGEDLGSVGRRLRVWSDQGFNVVAWDYSGYGRSSGEPSEEQLFADMEAMYKWLTEKHQISPKRLLLVGESLGGGPTTWIAAREAVGAVVLRSTFTSVIAVKIAWPPLPGDKFPNLKYMKKIAAPVLVAHGTEDRMIGPSHARKLAATTAGPRRLHWFEGAGHNDTGRFIDDRFWESVAWVLEAADAESSDR